MVTRCGLLALLLLGGCVTPAVTRSPAQAMGVTGASVRWATASGQFLGGHDPQDTVMHVNTPDCQLNRDARETAFAAIVSARRSPREVDYGSSGPFAPPARDEMSIVIRFERKQGEPLIAMVPRRVVSAPRDGIIYFNGSEWMLEAGGMATIGKVVGKCAPRVEWSSK